MKKNLRGQSLFEVIVALTIIGFIMVGLIEVATLSIKNSTFAKNKSQATSYAGQLTEWLRSERDTSWTTFKARFNANSTYCFDTLSSSSWSNSGVCGSNEFIPTTSFKRSAVFSCYNVATTPLPGAVACNLTSVVLIQAVTTISWVEGSVTHTETVTTNLTNSKSQ